MGANENLRQIKWLDYSENMYQLQKSIYASSQEYDTLLISADGNVFKSHRLILSGSSEFFYLLLKDIPLTEEPTIHIPDVESNVLDALLSFIYLGEVDMPMKLTTEFLDLCSYLQIKGVSASIN